MKILMALERDFPPDLRVENEIKSLITLGHKVVLACYTLEAVDSEFDWNGCRVYKRKISNFTYKSSVGALKMPFYFNFWKNHLLDIAEKEKPEAIHIHDLPLATVGAELKERFGIKFVLDLHENWPAYLRISKHANTLLGKILSSNSQWEDYEKESCHNADNVIVVIDEAKTRLENLGISKNKISVVANYPLLSDFEETSENNLNTEKPILFYAGGIAEHRGLQYVIGAIPELVKKIPELELWILGDGNYKQKLEELANQLNVNQHTKFFGHVPYKTVLEKLNESTIALIPHEKSEHTDTTIPHKLFQYMFAGKPVVASNCSPIERIIHNTNSGKVYQWDSSIDFAQKASEIIENIHNYSAENVKQQIVSIYNWDSQAQKLHEIYSE